MVRQLVEAGEDVRAVSRNPTGAQVYADLLHPETIPFDGVDRMYLFPVPETAPSVVARARDAGVRRIVDLSAAAVTIGLYVNPVEQAVEDSGLEWTHVRPSGFMANLLPVWAPTIRTDREVRYPFPDEAGVPVHEADIAAVAVAALLGDGHVGKAYTVTGPAPITAREQVAAIGEALGESVRFVEVSREQARQEWIARGHAPEFADFMLGFVSYGGTAGVDDDYGPLLEPWPGVEEATGRPARPYAEWARDHVADFR
ncbi:NmrA family transcriptional regulator [Lentzea sp. NBRC 105346]|nr:NmrA family transcriptional regulator [Lentzea sp. NBRC 105346]